MSTVDEPVKVIEVLLPGNMGPQGGKGDPGGPGWTPVIVYQADNNRIIAQAIDFVGGTGSKPAGYFVGPSGPVTDPADALDFTGALNAFVTAANASAGQAIAAAAQAQAAALPMLGLSRTLKVLYRDAMPDHAVAFWDPVAKQVLFGVLDEGALDVSAFVITPRNFYRSREVEPWGVGYDDDGQSILIDPETQLVDIALGSLYVDFQRALARSRESAVLPLMSDEAGDLWTLNDAGEFGMALDQDAREHLQQQLYLPPSGIPYTTQPMNIRWAAPALKAAMVQETDGQVSEVLWYVNGGLAAVVNDTRPVYVHLLYGQSNAGDPHTPEGYSPFQQPMYPFHAMTYSYRATDVGWYPLDAGKLGDLKPVYDTMDASDIGQPYPYLETLLAQAMEGGDRMAGLRSPGRAYFTVWYGGQPVTVFMPGTPTYTNLMISAGSIKADLANYGRDAVLSTITIVQGESGPNDATYEGLFSTLVQTVRTDTAAAFPQDALPVVCWVQTNAADNNAVNSRYPRLAHAKVARDLRGQGTALLGSMYPCQVNTDDGIHTRIWSRAYWSECMGDAKRVIEAGHDWVPLEVDRANISRSGAVITLPLLRPYGLPVQFDGDFVKTVANKGFASVYASGHTAPAITSVTTDGASITVTLASEPVEDWQLEYAMGQETIVDGWPAGRGLVMVETTRPSFYRRLADATNPVLATFSQIPQFIRHYLVADSWSIS